MRLHHRVRLIGRGVGRIELDRRRGERAGEVAHRGIGRTAGDALGLDRGVLRRREIVLAFGADIVDANQLRGGACLLEGLRHDDRDRLVVVLDFGTAEQLGSVIAALAELAGIFRGDDGEHAGRGLGRVRLIEAIRPLAMAEPTT